MVNMCNYKEQTGREHGSHIAVEDGPMHASHSLITNYQYCVSSVKWMPHLTQHINTQNEFFKHAPLSADHSCIVHSFELHSIPTFFAALV